MQQPQSGVSPAPVELTRIGHVALVTINRPERMNSLDPDSSAALSRIWDLVRDDDDIWVAVLTGRGERAFCTGFDLKWGRENPDADFETMLTEDGFGGLTARRDLLKPVIAAVQGYCLGGGFEIALACDIIVAGRTAQFGFPEPKVGNVAAWGGVHRLARSLPRSQVNRVLLAGEFLKAEEGMQLGLVYQVVEGDVAAAALALAEQMIKAAPLALQATKALYLEAFDRPLSECVAHAPSHPAMRRLQDSADHAEGLAAFAERREPRWTGR